MKVKESIVIDRPLEEVSGIPRPERVETVVIGGGQAGLSVGYHLARLGREFVILDASERIGDTWRRRWDSLRLFTPARFDGLPGMPFPAPANSFPTKDEMADYLETYAARFELPVEKGARVEGLSRHGERYLVAAGDRRLEADNVVVAMGIWQIPRVPDFAEELDAGIKQLHSSEYRSPSQLQDGAVLVVGASNSGAEIALETARERPTWLSGRDVGQVPFRIESFFGRHLGIPLVIGFLFHHVFTPKTPVGRKMRKKFLNEGHILVRTKRQDIVAAGIERVPRVGGVRDGRPVLEDGKVLDAANVIWATGYEPGLSWLDLPVFEADGQPRQERGVATSEPGLYFVGRPFTHSASSAILRGVGRDARYIAQTIASRTADRAPTRAAPEPATAAASPK